MAGASMARLFLQGCISTAFKQSKARSRDGSSSPVSIEGRNIVSRFEGSPRPPRPKKHSPAGRPPGRSVGVWLLLALGVAAWTPAQASGTYFVDNQSPGASDAGPGTEAKPYRTISAAV